MNHDHKDQGFTIVELMLAMTFVSFLLIAVALTVIQIGNTYTRGLTLKQVNQSGISISDELTRAISAAQPFDPTDGLGYFKQYSAGGAATGGRLCTGAYTYAWNIGLNPAVSGPNKYSDSSKPKIGLVKVSDSSRSYCMNPSSDIVFGDAAELLPEGERSIAVQGFAVERVTDSLSLSQALYQIQLQLGTDGVTASIPTADASCKPPSDADSLKEYCAVNKFEFTARAGNRGV